jgi:hypothetical protein
MPEPGRFLNRPDNSEINVVPADQMPASELTPALEVQLVKEDRATPRSDEADATAARGVVGKAPPRGASDAGGRHSRRRSGCGRRIRAGRHFVG